MVDPVAFGKHMARTMRDLLAPLKDRIDELEARKPEPGQKGDPGIAGVDGKDGRDAVIEYDDILKAVEEVHERMVAKHLLDLERRAMDTVQRAVAAIPPGKPGADGKDGKDGQPGEPGRDAVLDPEDLQRAVESAHERMVAKYALDFEIRASKTLQDVVDRIPMPRDGVDGQGVDGFEREYDSNTHEIVERWTTAGVVKSIRYPAGGIRAGGYWREGTKAVACEAWTHEGALWIAKRNTTTKPSVKSEDWYIAARKGRDGIDGKNGRDAPAAVALDGR
jgi:hypothetical protein